MTSIQPEIVVAGHICLDVIPDLPEGKTPTQFFIPGRLNEVGGVTISTGGAVSNTGLGLHRLGVSTRLIGKVGDDEFGRVILDLLRKMDPVLAEGMIVAPGEDSSYSIVLNLPGVDRIFLHYPGANHTSQSEDVQCYRLQGARMFHFGYPPIMKEMFRDNGEQLVDLMRKVKTQGLVTSLDMAMPDANSAAGQVDWHALLRASLAYVDIFLPSFEETMFMLKRDLYEQLLHQSVEGHVLSLVSEKMIQELAESLLEMGCPIIGLKLGDSGLYLRTGTESKIKQISDLLRIQSDLWANRELWVPCYKTRVAGTTGAGDSTIAGFLAGLLRGLPPEKVLNSAVAVGACCVERMDSLSGLLHWDKVQKRIADGWERLPINRKFLGWVWDKEHQLWIGPNDSTVNKGF
ncbi:sugar kinase [Collibacillus ludicampi]|uniref:Sugar kinase n=1 Tax=Collibacillus ludicampi TaxID=2771369 RepID=A0AAV4LAB2_9BACL|nr:PfkB family carbohydrate kinase [Collibacillus ludicampi]GIM44717.1 sugar kinase [Collibacillus ludicampi]